MATAYSSSGFGSSGYGLTLFTDGYIPICLCADSSLEWVAVLYGSIGFSNGSTFWIKHNFWLIFSCNHIKDVEKLLLRLLLLVVIWLLWKLIDVWIWSLKSCFHKWNETKTDNKNLIPDVMF